MKWDQSFLDGRNVNVCAGEIFSSIEKYSEAHRRARKGLLEQNP